jgi:hypothetical protein
MFIHFIFDIILRHFIWAVIASLLLLTIQWMQFLSICVLHFRAKSKCLTAFKIRVCICCRELFTKILKCDTFLKVQKEPQVSIVYNFHVIWSIYCWKFKIHVNFFPQNYLNRWIFILYEFFTKECLVFEWLTSSVLEKIQRSRVRFPALPDFLRSKGSGTGSPQARENNWGATWMKK